MPSVADFRRELYEAADRLETVATTWRLARGARDDLDELSDRSGALRMDAPWAVLPHAEIVMDEIVPRLRRLAADLENVPEPPPEGDSDA